MPLLNGRISHHCQVALTICGQVMRWIVRLVYWSLFLWALAEDAAEFPEEDGVLVLTEHFGMIWHGICKTRGQCCGASTCEC